MITGGHIVIYSKNAEADRAFFRDVLNMPNIDVGGSWLIFGLPPSELAVHPSDRNDVHEFFFMCEDIQEFAAEMSRHGVQCQPVIDESWGSVTRMMLPGGGKLSVYQPFHSRPEVKE